MGRDRGARRAAGRPPRRGMAALGQPPAGHHRLRRPDRPAATWSGGAEHRPGLGPARGLIRDVPAASRGSGRLRPARSDRDHRRPDRRPHRRDGADARGGLAAPAERPVLPGARQPRGGLGPAPGPASRARGARRRDPARRSGDRGGRRHTAHARRPRGSSRCCLHRPKGVFPARTPSRHGTAGGGDHGAARASSGAAGGTTPASVWIWCSLAMRTVGRCACPASAACTPRTRECSPCSP